MADAQDNVSKTQLEEEVWAAVSAFEQILEAMPNDRASLDALSNAYEQIGDHTRALEYLVRLGHVLVDESDIEEAAEVLTKLQAFGDDAPETVECIERIGKFLSGEEVESFVSPEGEEALQAAEDDAAAAEVRTTFNMEDELSFAWNLMEAGELTQEEYASVVQDLTEMSAGDVLSPVSVLHALEARGFKGLERVIAHVSKECRVPAIPSACFDIKSEAGLLLPLDFMLRRGALVFDLMGKDALAAVMNPYDKTLAPDLKAVTGKNCHLFLTLPAEFDQALGRIADVQADKSSLD